MPDPVTFAEFLMKTPPLVKTAVTKMSTDSQSTNIALPGLFLHCNGELCEDGRFFDGKARYNSTWAHDSWDVATLEYTCRNCKRFSYLFAVSGKLEAGTSGDVFKFGQWPAHGPPIPAKLVSLVGPDRELLIKANRAHSQGLGVGSFAYYRRIVENQRNRIFDAIIKVAKTQPGSEEFATALERAKSETQFTKSVATLKPALPPSFLIDGHNPLSLLHDLLSDGIHALTDEECLDRSEVVRTVLTALARRLDELSTEHKEIRGALAKIINKQPPTAPPG